MAPNPTATMDDLQPPAENKSIESTSSTSKTQPKPPKHSNSFYKRFRHSPTTKEIKNKSIDPIEFVQTSTASVDEFKSVQSLKQFWINAFASIKNNQKKPKHPETLAKTNERKCATLGGNNKQTRHTNSPERSFTLHRNFSTSLSDATNNPSSTKPQTTSLTSNRLSVDNFYKYKTADIVKQRQNSSGEDTAEIHITYLDPLSPFESDSTDTQITMLIRHKTTATDDSPNSANDKIAETEAQSPPKSQLIKTDSSNSLATSTTNDSVSSSRKSTSTHHGVTRKCSFRTNISHHTNHNHHRKLMAASSSGSATGDSKVAALTHRFNQLCQQDADRIREEVRRNKHVVVHRVNGKVFKVMAEDSVPKKGTVMGRISSDSSVASPVRLMVSKKDSIRRKDRPPLKTDVKALNKPKVPEKSPQVIMRTKEIVDKKKHKSLSTLDEVATASTGSPAVDTKTTTEDVLDSRLQSDIIESIIKDQLSVPDVPEDTEEEIPKKKKYIRLYEKFRFRPSFMSSSKKALLRAAPDTSYISSDPDLPPDDPASVQKIVDAISKASQRIELLSKSESCLIIPKDEPPVKPNDSFLFRSTTNGLSSDYHQHVSGLVEAINPCVMGKSRSMDDVFITEHLLSDDRQSTTEMNAYPKHELIRSSNIVSQTNEEDDYEIISPPTEDTKPFCLETQPSFLYKSISKKQSAAIDKPIVKSEIDCTDIYQSIAEVFNTNSTSTGLPTDQESVNSYESYENYESLDEKLIEQIKSENGYEPLDPPPEPPPPRLSTSSLLINSPEPPLPVPKRNPQNFALTKCNSSSSNYEHIKYDKIPPRPPKCAPLPPEPIPPPEEDACSPDNDYDTENIYDTIAAVARRLPNQMQKSNSSYYESVGRQPSFVRGKRFSKISMADSDTGSTISSDNKTNSLYGAAMSRRESVSPPSEVSDNNSDDWVDISDGEQEEGSDKLVV